MKRIGTTFWRILSGAIWIVLLVGAGWCDSSYTGQRVVSWTGRGGATVSAVAGELLVKFKDGTSGTRESEIHRAASATVARKIQPIGVSLVKLPAGVSLEEGMASYRARPEVEFAEPNYIRHLTATPNDPYYGQQSHLPIIKAADAWDVSTGSQNVVIAVIDTGVMLNHPDLKANIWVNKGEIPGNGIDDDKNGFVDDVNGYDFIQDDGDPNPRDNATQAAGRLAAPQQFQQIEVMDHGSHVAGLAAAVGNNGIGVTGVSWKASIMAVRIFDEQGGGATAEVLSKGIIYAADNGAKVINMSLGGAGSSETERQAVNHALGKDVVVLAAAGNDNLDLDVNPFYPIGYDGVIGVASTNMGDVKSDFSNYGTRDVDISAPGGNGDPVWALLSTAYYDPNDASYGDPYGLAQGTSMATPIVAGAAALIRALNPALTRTDVEKLLKDGADNIDDVNPDYVGKLGAGRLNVFESLVLTKPAPKIQILFPTQGDISYSLTPTVIGIVSRLSPRVPAIDAQSVVINVDETQKFSSATDVGYDAQTGQLQVTLPALAQGQHTLTVEASDVQGNHASSPSISFRVETFVLPKGVQMFSVPHLLTRTDPTSVLGEVSPHLSRWESNGTSSGGGTYHNWASGTTDPFVTSVVPGRAYWVENAQDAPLRVEGGAVPFDSFNLSEEYQGTAQDPLRPGWHQMGTPFPFAISSGSLLFEGDNLLRLSAAQAVAAGWVGRTLYWYTSKGYSWSSLEDGVMEPFVGYWIRTLVPCRVIIPPVGTSISRSTKPVARSMPEGGWKVALTVQAGKYVDGANVFGTATGASDGNDVWDIEKPPTPGLTAGFTRGGGLYAQDLRAEAGGTKSWDLLVKTSSKGEPVRLDWSDLRSVPRDVTLVLTDLETNKQIFMRTSSGYIYKTLADGEQRRFRVIAQEATGALRLGPVALQRSRATGAEISVSVTQPALVTVGIVGLSGELLRQVVEKEAVLGGVSTFYWDGKDAQGTLLPAGSYLCEVRAETEEGESVSAVTSFSLTR